MHPSLVGSAVDALPVGCGMTQYVQGVIYPDRMRIEWQCPYCGYRRGYQIAKVYRNMQVYCTCPRCEKSFMTIIGGKNHDE